MPRALVCSFWSELLFKLDTRADVAVRIRSRVVTVHVEQPVILVLVVIATHVQDNSAGVVVAVVVK